MTKTHVISTHDSKSQATFNVELLDPSPPFGAQFPPGPLSIVLRNWSPTKFIIICGDGPSPDIGLIGSLSPDGAPDAWVNFTLEETSTPSLPLEENAQDMALLGLEIDLTSSKSVRMSEQPDDGTPDLPPSPILYAYMSDGTVVAWHVLNRNGTTYPGMVTATTDASMSSTRLIADQRISMEESGMSSPTPALVPLSTESSTQPQRTSGFGQTPLTLPSTSNPPAQGFGAFGQASAAPAFGASSFGSKLAAPAFGAPSFGSKPAAPAFGQSGFNSLSSSNSSVTSSGGFAAFASQGTSSFGAPVSSSSGPQSAFGAGGSGQATIPPRYGFGPGSSGQANSTSTSSFGTGGLGSATSFAQQPVQSSSPFGSFGVKAAPPAFGQSAFGAGGSGQAMMPPRSAFGPGGSGQANSTSTSSFGTGGGPGSATSFAQQPVQSSSPFGSFGVKAAPPAFGQSAFASASIPATSQGGAFASLGTLGDSLKHNVSTASERVDSARGSPPSPGESPPGSPKHPSSAQSTKPTSSYLKPAEGFGAFIKPSGAFGAPGDLPKPQATGAFASSSGQKPIASTSVQLKPAASSAGFTLSGSPAGTSTAMPTFGSTSALGRSKPAFGTSTFGTTPQRTTSDLSKPITGGFSAFSSGGGSFASFANASNSSNFDDILSSGDQDKPKSVEPPLALGNTSKSKASNVPPVPISAEQAPTSTGGTSSPSVASELPDKAERAGSAENVAEKELPPEDDKTSQEPSSSLKGVQDTSFSLLSLSDARPSSTLQGSTESLAENANKEISGDPEADGDAPEAEEDSTSEPFSLTDDGFDGSTSDQPSRSPTRSSSEGEPEEPENVPLPETPTPRSTPTATPVPSPLKLPVVDVSTPLPTASTSLPATEKLNATTPPGSPENPVGPFPVSVGPKPLVPTPTASPFGLGLGRPSSRPIRSSPLASAPITSTDDEDPAPYKTPSKPPPATVNVKSAEPTLTQASSSTEPPMSSGISTSSSVNRQPSTSPLLDVSTVPGAKTTPLRSPLDLGRPQDLPMPFKAKELSPSTQSISVTHSRALPASPREDETEDVPKHPMQIEFQHAYQEMVKELIQVRGAVS